MKVNKVISNGHVFYYDGRMPVGVENDDGIVFWGIGTDYEIEGKINRRINPDYVKAIINKYMQSEVS